MFYFKNTFLFFKIDLNKICITQIRQNSCASVNQCWVGIERKAKYHSCIRLWTHAYIRFKVGMPLILHFMMCEIVNVSKDSKPTKIEIKEKLWCCTVKMPRYLGDVVSLGGNVLQGVDGDVQHVKCILCSYIQRKDMTLGVKLDT